MAGHNPLVAEYTARDGRKGACLLWCDLVFGTQAFRTSAGLILTGATTPIVAQPTLTSAASDTATVNVVRWAANVANAVTFAAVIPGDYNEALDKCHLRLLLFKSTAGNTGINMNCTIGVVRSGIDYTSAAIVKTPTAQAISDATTPSVLDFTLSGYGLKGKDQIGFSISPDAHDTCVIDMHGATMRYSGGLSIYNDADNYATS